jgi:hypothetical protein
MAALLVAVLAQHVAIYRAQHRPVAELAPLAEAALGAGGRVAVDARTASLVLAGTPADVERALALLARLDRRLRTVVIEYSLEELAEFEAAGLRVDWWGHRGALRVGALASGGVAGGASRGESTRTFRARLRLLEGEPGLLTTGVAVPLPGSFGSVLHAESGFEVLPTLLGSGRLHVKLRPFDGRLEGGGVRYTAAATELELAPGETLVVAEVRQTGAEETLALPPGAARRSAQLGQVLLLRVDLEP